MTQETDNYARNRTTNEIVFFNSFNPPTFRYPGEWAAFRKYPSMPNALHLIGEPSDSYAARGGKAQ